MGVYNGAAALPETVRSILAQDFCDFELIIVEDGSTDATPQLLQKLASEDSRIRVLTQSNGGLTRALIRGCAAARGEFLARQDAGDVSLPGRFRRQVEYLDRHSEVVLVGSNVIQEATDGEQLGVLTFAEDIDEATRRFHDDGVAPVHVSTMFRRDDYERCGGYREQFFCAQDHDLWHRLLSLGKLGFVGEPLCIWRLDDTGISTRKALVQRQMAELAIACAQARREGRPESELLSQAEQLRHWKGPVRQSSPAQARAEANYHMGSRLQANRDARCRKYLLRAIASNPVHWRAWLKLIASAGLLATARQTSTTG